MCQSMVDIQPAAAVVLCNAFWWNLETRSTADQKIKELACSIFLLSYRISRQSGSRLMWTEKLKSMKPVTPQCEATFRRMCLLHAGNDTVPSSTWRGGGTRCRSAVEFLYKITFLAIHVAENDLRQYDNDNWTHQIIFNLENINLQKSIVVWRFLFSIGVWRQTGWIAFMLFCNIMLPLLQRDAHSKRSI